MTYESRHFKIEELVPPETVEYFEGKGGKQNAWWLFDTEGILCLDLLRDDLGPCTINNWLWGGTARYRGFRPAGCGVGAEYSMHRFGKGFDLTFRNSSPDQVREHIRQNRERFQWIRGVELGFWEGGAKRSLPWVHIDGRNSEKFMEFWV